MTEVDIENQVDKAHDGGEGETGLSKEDEHAMEELLQESKQDSTPRLSESKQERLQESKRESPNVVCNGKTDDVRGRFLSIENRIDKQATELNSAYGALWHTLIKAGFNRVVTTESWFKWKTRYLPSIWVLGLRR